MISSAEEVYAIMILIVPGFFADLAVRRISMDDTERKAHEVVIYSVAYSVVSLSIIYTITGVMTFEDLVGKLFNLSFLNLLLYTPVVLGILVGLGARILHRDAIYPNDCWILFQKKLAKKGSWIVVFTKDGKEIEGYLNYAGRLNADKELIITDPVEITRKDDETFERKLGSEMMFLKDSIYQISFDEHF